MLHLLIILILFKIETKYFRTANESISQTVFFTSGTLLLNLTNSSLNLINIELEFEESLNSNVLIILDNEFAFEMHVNHFFSRII